jgi:hypothetical protein
MKYRIWVEVCFVVDTEKEMTEEQLQSFSIEPKNISYWDGTSDIYLDEEESGDLTYQLKYVKVNNFSEEQREQSEL